MAEQAWGAALCFGVFGLLPLNCASTFGGALARHIGPRLGISNRARRNLRRALPELSDDEIARVVAGMWDNLGRVVAEYPHLRKIDVFEPGGRVEIRGLEYINRAVATGRRMILFPAISPIGRSPGLPPSSAGSRSPRSIVPPTIHWWIA